MSFDSCNREARFRMKNEKRKTKDANWCVGVMACIISVLVCAVSNGGDLRAGAAVVVINPEPGTPLAGYYNPRAAEGVHDDLHAKALVLEKDGVRVALVACDLLTLPRSVVEESRRMIETGTGIAGGNVMISATHSHTGPIVPMGSTRDPSEGGAMAKVNQYAQTLPQLIARCVGEANGKLTAVKLYAGHGREEHLSFNRRYFMKDGTVGWNPGKLNPQIERPAGPIDPDVPVLYAESLDGKPVATYVNFAMHLDTVGGLQLSADYPATIAELLGRVRGPEMVTVFTTGTCGDINHVDVSTKDPQHGPAEAARIGTILAGEVIKTYARMDALAPEALRVKSAMVTLALPDVSGADLEQARKTAVKFGKDAPKFLERVNAYKVLDVAARQGKPLEVEVQVIALGDELAWVSMPGEIFVELGLAVKKESPFRNTVIAELANGSVGYIPTRRAYAEGNYEPVSARCAAGSGEALVETALKLLRELHGK
jgi:neutral ceramidase